MTVKAILFDLYGTLLDIRTDEESPDTWLRFAAWMENHGMAARPETLRREFSFGTRVLAAQPGPFACPEPDILPVFAAMCGARGGDPAMGEQAALAFRRASTRLLRPYPETMSTLRFLRERGIRRVLLSNAQACFTRPELALTGLDRELDAIFLSSEAGCKKPDPAFFHLALAQCHLRPEECLMVGNDGSSDIAGATAAGLEAVYLRTEISPKEPLPHCRWVFADGDIGNIEKIVGE